MMYMKFLSTTVEQFIVTVLSTTNIVFLLPGVALLSKAPIGFNNKRKPKDEVGSRFIVLLLSYPVFQLILHLSIVYGALWVP